MNSKEEALYLLFRGRLNVPAAAGRCGLTPEQMQKEFKDYASRMPVEDWELDIVLCWPYT
jgi:hypothetical protein